MDIKTTLFLILITQAMYVGLLFFLRDNRFFAPNKSVVNLLLLSNLLVLTGTLLRLLLPDTHLIISALNLILIAGVYFKIKSLNGALKLKNPKFTRLIYLILIIFILLLNYYTFIIDDFQTRSIIFSILLGITYLVVSLEIKISQVINELKKFAFGVILFISITFFIRILLVLNNEYLIDFYENNTSNFIYILNIYISELIFTPFIYLVLHLENSFQLESTKKELTILNNQKSRILSIIGHDLRTPFNSLLGFSSLMLNHRNLSAERVSQFSKSIFEISSSTLYQLENLLKWANLTTIGEDLQMAKIDLEDLQSILIEQCGNLANGKGITLSIAYPKDTFIYANTTMMNSALFNLVNNAIKFSYPDSEVFVEAQEQDNFILFKVSDKGMGIPQEKLETLLNSQVNESTQGTVKETGSGLGLVICQEMIKRQGGQIWVESTEGIGTTFYFTIPKWEEEKVGKSN